MRFVYTKLTLPYIRHPRALGHGGGLRSYILVRSAIYIFVYQRPLIAGGAGCDICGAGVGVETPLAVAEKRRHFRRRGLTVLRRQTEWKDRACRCAPRLEPRVGRHIKLRKVPFHAAGDAKSEMTAPRKPKGKPGRQFAGARGGESPGSRKKCLASRGNGLGQTRM